MSQTKQADRNYTYVRPETRKKFRFIADKDRRSLVDTVDIIADEALERRGIDPQTLKPVKVKS